jgi:formylglycine-generating enzyme required for sulfatase activity
MGLGCSAVIVLGLLTAEILSLNSDLLNEPDTPIPATEVSLNFTDTPLPTIDLQATVAAMFSETQAALEALTPTVGVVQQVSPPTATPPPPTLDPVNQVTPTDLPTQAPETVVDLGTRPGVQSEIPDSLQGIVSDLLVVDGGTFLMGTTAQEAAGAVNECQTVDEGNCVLAWAEDSFPQHSVTVDTFRMEKTEVTNLQYVAFLSSMEPGSHRNGCFGQKCVDTTSENEDSAITFDGANYDVSPLQSQLPVVGVTWYGARAYCEAIGRRLPTEAEWERAARGPSNFIYPWGNERNLTLARTNRPDRPIGPIDVGSFLLGASPYGMLDMAGNVAEWVFDYYAVNYYAQPEASGLNPTGPASGTDRVIRGGSWDAVPFFSRSVHRQNERPVPEDTHLWLGFRCADDLEDNTFSDVVPSSLGPTPVLATESPREAIDAQPTIPPLATLVPNNPTEAPAVPPAGNN